MEQLVEQTTPGRIFHSHDDDDCVGDDEMIYESGGDMVMIIRLLGMLHDCGDNDGGGGKEIDCLLSLTHL